MFFLLTFDDQDDREGFYVFPCRVQAIDMASERIRLMVSRVLGLLGLAASARQTLQAVAMDWSRGMVSKKQACLKRKDVWLWLKRFCDRHM